MRMTDRAVLTSDSVLTYGASISMFIDRARFCEYTVANAPKIVRMRLNKQPWSHFFFIFIFF